jgi:UDP-glucose 4-epimerase
LLALKKLAQATNYAVYNIGSGIGTSESQLVQAVAEQTKRMVTVQAGTAPISKPGVLVADITKAQQELGFQPRFSDLQNIIHTSCALG